MWKKITGFLKTKKRAVVIGIDGVPCSLLHQFIQDGTMPNTAQIVRQGTLSPMETSLPEISSVAWTSFMTGCNPGRHGIYGFMDLKPNSYKMYFPSFNDIKAPTLWDEMGKLGKRSIVINLPGTYPAREINGVLSAGFVAIDLKKATYPESAYQYLNSIGYKIDVNTDKARESLDALLEDINLTFQKRAQALLHFFENEQWDLFIGVITETDRLHHFLWEAIEDPQHKYHGAFREFYRRMDKFIGQIYERCNHPQDAFMLVSDHGFTRIKHEVYLNNWLKEQGYLKFEKEPPASLDDLSEQTYAFVLDPSRVYINLKGRFPKGRVNPGHEYDALRNKLMEELSRWEVIKKVYKKEEIYRGKYLDRAPDLVLLSQDGYDLKGSIKKPTLMGNDVFTGMHTQTNAVCFINRKGLSLNNVNIIDVAPTVMQLMDHPITSMGGRDLVDAA
ncbi:MAG: alkaline phosphatase family protein [Candidatus Schekmanbacteria bacterium]|nr:alkaline phosphatase family protein [Candidatus Schekmanbacteria bacterium]